MPKPVVIECWVVRNRIKPGEDDPERIDGRLWATTPIFDDRQYQRIPYEDVTDAPAAFFSPIIRPVAPGCRHRARITVEFLEDE